MPAFNNILHFNLSSFRSSTRYFVIKYFFIIWHNSYNDYPYYTTSTARYTVVYLHSGRAASSMFSKIVFNFETSFGFLFKESRFIFAIRRNVDVYLLYYTRARIFYGLFAPLIVRVRAYLYRMNYNILFVISYNHFLRG